MITPWFVLCSSRPSALPRTYAVLAKPTAQHSKCSLTVHVHLLLNAVCLHCSTAIGLRGRPCTMADMPVQARNRWSKESRQATNSHYPPVGNGGGQATKLTPPGTGAIESVRAYYGSNSSLLRQQRETTAVYPAAATEIDGDHLGSVFRLTSGYQGGMYSQAHCDFG